MTTEESKPNQNTMEYLDVVAANIVANPLKEKILASLKEVYAKGSRVGYAKGLAAKRKGEGEKPTA